MRVTIKMPSDVSVDVHNALEQEFELHGTHPEIAQRQDTELDPVASEED
jgi:hypothetical protein